MNVDIYKKLRSFIFYDKGWGKVLSRCTAGGAVQGGDLKNRSITKANCCCHGLPLPILRRRSYQPAPLSSSPKDKIHLTPAATVSTEDKDKAFRPQQTDSTRLEELKGTTVRSTMVSTGLQMLGAALATIGWIGTIIVCAIPMWRVTAFIGSNIVTSQTIWEGIWMNCVVQSTGQMQCKVYDSMLALSSDLQAARALTIISIVVGVLGILLAVAGGQCTNMVEDKSSKAKVAITAGIVFIVAGILCLVPVCWTASTIIQDFYNPMLVSAQKRELGASLFIGWGASALMLIGGGMLCCGCPDKEDGSYAAKYKAARSNASAPASSKGYV